MAQSETGAQVRRRLAELEAAEHPVRIKDEPVARESSEAVSAAPHTSEAIQSLATGNGRLIDSLTGAMAACRQRRVPLSLLLVQLDAAEELTRRDPQAAAGAARGLSEICHGIDHAERRCYQLIPGCLAVLLVSCERQQAVRMGQQLLAAWRRSTAASPATLAGVSISIGLAAVALLPRNFPVQELIAGAARCLSGAQACGGNCLKSIEL
jgi:GGDEF domain-containing protein